jgi:hypothetical protein
MNIEKDHCDYYLEVYYWEHTLVEKVVTKKGEGCFGLSRPLPGL